MQRPPQIGTEPHQRRTYLRRKDDEYREPEIQQRVPHHELQSFQSQNDRYLVEQANAKQSQGHLDRARSSDQLEQSINDGPNNQEVDEVHEPQLAEKPV